MLKKLAIVGVVFLVFIGFIAWGIYVIKTHPEEVSAFFEQVTLPYKIAKLASQEPETAILMPVYEKRVSQIADTWGAPRGEERSHEGQDIFAPKGTPVFSGTAGYVLYVGTVDLGGKVVYVVGAGGRRYYYAHLDSFAKDLHAGQKVSTDTVLGFVGNTGNAETTPPHLHFGVYSNREAINPMPLLTNR